MQRRMVDFHFKKKEKKKGGGGGGGEDLTLFYKERLYRIDSFTKKGCVELTVLQRKVV